MKAFFAKTINAVLKRSGFQLVSNRYLDSLQGTEEDFSAYPNWQDVQGKLRDLAYYRPHFQPWQGYDGFGQLYDQVSPYTLVSREKCYVLRELARHALNFGGDFAECGVYRGGTAMILNAVLADARSALLRKLHLFDTFSGMPETNQERDWHQHGDFSDTSESAVKARLVRPDLADFHPGLVPETFAGLNSIRFAFVHIDLDIYQGILDACEFMYPRVSPGGVMVFDDYFAYTCPGARDAVDQFFRDKKEKPIVLPNYTTLVIKT